ncbi:MAG: hypothetical protein JWR26_1629 [Pedosphaera sp.]|nr:hypothetical protein [Pedosphaera sp.]
MATVNWQWGLLTTGSGNASHRVARRGTSAISPPTALGSSGVDNASPSSGGWSWTPSPSAEAPAKLTDANGKSYIFAFWSVQGGTSSAIPVGSSIVNNPGSFSVPVGADNNAKAIAYYVWDFGVSGGANAVLIDAFDQNAGFLTEDFVNVSPEDGLAHTDPKSLYWRANDGLLITDPPNADITQKETITAFDIAGRKFNYWLEIKALTSPGVNGPSVNGTDLHVMSSCVLVAFAVYSTLPPQPPGILPRYYLYNPWWMVETHGGLTPGGPPGPFGPWGPFKGQVATVVAVASVLLVALAAAAVVLLLLRR